MNLLLWAIACATGESDATLVDEIYAKQLQGNDFLSVEERRELKENTRYQTEAQYAQIEAFAKFLSDDDLSDKEKTQLAQLGVDAGELAKYDWHHAWTKAAFQSLASFTGPDEAGEIAIFDRVLKSVGAGSMNWDEKLSYVEAIEGNVIAEYAAKPASAAKAIELYAAIEPDGKSVPRVFEKILLSEEFAGRAALVAAIKIWAKTTRNPVVSGEFAAMTPALQTSNTPLYADFAEVAALVATPEDFPSFLAAFAGANSGALAKGVKVRQDAVEICLMWEKSGTPLPDPLKEILAKKRADDETARVGALLASCASEPRWPQSLTAEFAAAPVETLDIWVAAVAARLEADPKLWPEEDFRSFKDRALKSGGSANAVTLLKIEKSRPGFLAPEDDLLLGAALDAAELAACPRREAIRAAALADASPIGFSILVKMVLSTAVRPSADDIATLKTKAKHLGLYLETHLEGDLAAENTKLAAYWRELVEEEPQGMIGAFRGLTNNPARGKLLDFMKASSHREEYRAALRAELPAAMKVRLDDPRFVLEEIDARLPVPLQGGFAVIPEGTFKMGSTDSDNEDPVHEVTLTSWYLMAKYETTNEAWSAVTGLPVPSKEGYDAPRQPVTNVTWTASRDFCAALSVYVPDGYEARLPTEAEWERAARGPHGAKYATADGGLSSKQANYGGYSRPLAVGSYPPNPYGLHEMSGNVYEWTGDDYVEYSEAPVTDPKTPATSDYRTIRGGGGDSNDPRVTYRFGKSPDFYNYDLGLRCAIAVKPVTENP